MIGVLGAIINAHLKDPLTERTKRVLKIGAYLGTVGIFFAVWASTSFARNQLGLHIPFWPGDQNYLAAQHRSQSHRHEPGGPAGVARSTSTRPTGCSGASRSRNWSFLFVTLAAFRVKEWFPNRRDQSQVPHPDRRSAQLRVVPLALPGAALHRGMLHRDRGTTGRVGDHYRTPDEPRAAARSSTARCRSCSPIPTYFLVEKKALEIKDRFQVERTTTAQDIGARRRALRSWTRCGDDSVAGNGSVNGSRQRRRHRPRPEPPSTPARGSPGAS